MNHRQAKVEVPTSVRTGRAITAFGALVLATAGITFLMGADVGQSIAAPNLQVSFPPPSAPTSGTSQPTVVPSGAKVSLTSPDGSPELGRDVVASGLVGNRKFACYVVGWYAQTSGNTWSASFLAAEVTPDASGSFRTLPMHMGSPGETSSSWWPFLLGMTQPGCDWYRQQKAQGKTVEYDRSLPPPYGAVLYYSPSAVHRVS